LKLYTPAKYDSLPGLPFPAAPYTFPTGRELADYLESYAAEFALPVRGGVSVDRVTREVDGWTVTAGATSYRAANVVVATGGEQLPSTPAFARELDPGIRQLHSDRYHNPSQLLPCGVLVVGASHSGADLALEVAQAGHTIWLCGRDTGHIPFDIESRPARLAIRLLWFLAKHVLTVGTPLGRKMQPDVRNHGGPLLRVKNEHLEAAGVQRVQGRMAGVRDGLPLLEDGRVLDVSNVIWCTGFRHDFSWIEPWVTGPDGWPVQERGVATGVPGLYFAGLLFQYSFTSMLVGGAGRDAAYVAAHIARRSPVHERSPAPAA
jgi:putative flavoprotein involved in K+ transport